MKHRGRFLPTDAQAPVVLEPADRVLDCPATLVAAKFAAVLGLILGLPVGAVRGDHVHSDLLHPSIEFVGIVGLVADDPLGEVDRHHEVEQWLDQGALVRTRAARVHGDRQAVCIHHDHDLRALSGLGAADSIAHAFRLGERAIHEALVEFEAVTLLDHLTESSKQLLESTHFHPTLKGPVNRTLLAELCGEVLPLCSVVEDPEDASDGFAAIRSRSATLRLGWVFGEEIAEHIQLVFREFHHRSTQNSHLATS